MSRMCAFRSVLASGIILLVTLWAVPAYSWHGTGNITAVAIDPLTPTTLYAGTTDRGVFKTTDAGTTWSASSLTNVGVYALAIGPQAPSIVCAGTNGGVSKISLGGQSWCAINTGLADLYVADVVIDLQNPTTLYALIPRLQKRGQRCNWSGTGLMTGHISNHLNP